MIFTHNNGLTTVPHNVIEASVLLPLLEYIDSDDDFAYLDSIVGSDLPDYKDEIEARQHLRHNTDLDVIHEQLMVHPKVYAEMLQDFDHLPFETFIDDVDQLRRAQVVAYLSQVAIRSQMAVYAAESVPAKEPTDEAYEAMREALLAGFDDKQRDDMYESMLDSLQQQLADAPLLKADSAPKNITDEVFLEDPDVDVDAIAHVSKLEQASSERDRVEQAKEAVRKGATDMFTKMKLPEVTVVRMPASKSKRALIDEWLAANPDVTMVDLDSLKGGSK